LSKTLRDAPISGRGGSRTARSEISITGNFCDGGQMANPTIPRRHTIRLHRYDYSPEGFYFVTVCTDHGGSLFGEVVDGKMNLNDAGKIVDEVWAGMFRVSEVSDTWDCGAQSPS
jgi:hypothetical protein